MEIREYHTYCEAEILPLYDAVGWRAYTANPALLQQAYAHSLMCFAAYEGEALVGIVRIVGDGETVVFVQDLLVSPAYQRRGIGSALVKTVLECFSHVRQIQLTTDHTPETGAFYESLGFRALETLGMCGFMKA